MKTLVFVSLFLRWSMSAFAYDRPCSVLPPIQAHDPGHCQELNGDFELPGNKGFFKIHSQKANGSLEIQIVNRWWHIDPQMVWPFTADAQVDHIGFWSGSFATVAVCEPDGINFLIVDEDNIPDGKTWTRLKLSKNDDGTIRYRQCAYEYEDMDVKLTPRQRL